MEQYHECRNTDKLDYYHDASICYDESSRTWNLEIPFLNNWGEFEYEYNWLKEPINYCPFCGIKLDGNTPRKENPYDE